jgi:tRNA-dihydrouridine synthase B
MPSACSNSGMRVSCHSACPNSSGEFPAIASTGADAIMIGRAAQGRPWIFREIAHFLATGTHLAPPLVAEVRKLLLEHLQDHYALYGDFTGVRSARKHIAWYVRALPGGEAFRARMNTLDDCQAQGQAVADFFDELAVASDRMPASLPAAPAPGVDPHAMNRSAAHSPPQR